MTQSFPCGGKRIGLDVLNAAGHGTSRQPALMLLHGAGGNIGFWLSRLEPALAESGILLFAPHYFDRTGTVRAELATISDGVHVPLWLDTLECAAQFVASHPQVNPERIAVIGISLGAFLAMSWAALQSAQSGTLSSPRPRCVVELSGGLPEPYASQATPRLPPTLILHGEQDTVVPVQHARDLDGLLANLGVAHETRLLPSEGHWFSSAAQWQLLLAVSGFLSRYLKAHQAA